MYILCNTVSVKEPSVAWEESEITVNEGEERQICFVVDSGSAVPYEVEVGVHGKGTLPATGKSNVIYTQYFFVHI